MKMNVSTGYLVDDIANLAEGQYVDMEAENPEARDQQQQVGSAASLTAEFKRIIDDVSAAMEHEESPIIEQVRVLMHRGIDDQEIDEKLEAKFIAKVEEGERIAGHIEAVSQGRIPSEPSSSETSSNPVCCGLEERADYAPWDDHTYEVNLSRYPALQQQLSHARNNSNALVIRRLTFSSPIMAKVVSEFIWRHPDIVSFTMEYVAGLFGVRALPIAHALWNAQRLKVINIAHTDATVEFTAALSFVAMNSTFLETVIIRETQLKDIGAIFWGIALAKGAHNLRHIDLTGGGIGYRGATALALGLRSHVSSLRVLNLSHNKIGRTGCMQLGEALVANPVLEELNVSRNNIGSRGASALAAFLCHPNAKLRVLDASENDIGRNGGKALAIGVSMNKSIQKLILNKNDMGDQGSAGFGEALTRNTSLEELELNDNDMTDLGPAAIAIGLKTNSTLRRLCLMRQVIRDAGAFALAEALKSNVGLRSLHLEHNGITDFGATSLARMLSVNVSLKELRLNDNEIGNKGGIELSKVLSEKHNRHLEVLDLTNNPISKQVARTHFAAAENRLVTDSTQRLDVIAQGVAIASGNLREFGVVVIRTKTSGILTIFLIVFTVFVSWFDFISDIIVAANEFKGYQNQAPGASLAYAVLTTVFVAFPFAYILIVFSLPADETDTTLPIERMRAEAWRSEEMRRHLDRVGRSKCSRERAFLTLINIFQLRVAYELYISWRNGLTTLAYSSIRLVEVVFESLPQSLIQLHIFLSPARLQQIANSGLDDRSSSSNSTTLVLFASIATAIITLARTMSDLFEKKYVVSWKRHALHNEELAMVIGNVLAFLYHFFHYIARSLTIVIACHIYHPIICVVLFIVGVGVRMIIGLVSDRRRMFAVVSYFVGSASWDGRIESRAAKLLELVELGVAIAPLWIPQQLVLNIVNDSNYMFVFQTTWAAYVTLDAPPILTALLGGSYLLSVLIYLSFIERIHFYSDTATLMVDSDEAARLATRAFKENTQAIRKRRRQKLAAMGGEERFSQLVIPEDDSQRSVI